jgi:hypothetical protein
MKLGRAWPPGRVVLTLMMLVTVAFTLGGPTSASPQDAPTLSVDPAMKQAYLGETFTVSVDIADAQDVVGYQFMLDYDPAVVSLSNPTDGGFLESAPNCTIAGGTVTCTALDTPPYDGGADSPGTLITLDAEIVGTGATALALHGAQVSDVDAETMEPELEDGMVDAVVALEVVPSSAGRSVNVGTFTETVMIHNASDLAGFQFEMGFDPAVVTVDSVAVGPFLESEGRTVNAGLVNEVIDNDAGTLFFAAASLPPGDAPDGPGALAVITFNAVAKGDTALDLHGSKVYDDEGVEMMPANIGGMIHVVDEGINVVPGHQEVFEGKTFEVDIQVGDAQDLAGYEFTLGFDETLVNVDDVVVGPFLTDVFTRTKVIDNENGTVFFGAFSLEGETADVGTLATVHLTALEVDADMTSPLDIMAPLFFDSAGDDTTPKHTNGDVLVKNCIPVTIESLVADSSVEMPTALGDPVQFTATVSGSEPITYEWDFGSDEGTATGADTATPTFTYDAADTYTVTLTAENCGGPVEETVVIKVCDPVTITDIGTDSPVELGETMHFTATVDGTPPFGYSWDFGDGTAPVELPVNVASHTYAETGTYTVTLTVGNCSMTNPFTATDSVTVEVTEPTYKIFLPFVAQIFAP